MDDWYLKMVEVMPGEYQLRLMEPNTGNRTGRVIEKSLNISEAMDLHDIGGRALRHIARTFR